MYTWLHLYEMSRIGKFVVTERLVMPGGEVRRSWEETAAEYGVSFGGMKGGTDCRNLQEHQINIWYNKKSRFTDIQNWCLEVGRGNMRLRGTNDYVQNKLKTLHNRRNI